MKSAWRHCRRLELSSAETKVPDLAYLGRYNYTHAAPALPRHVHKQCMELCFLLRGRQTYRVGQRTYNLSGGDIFVTFPDEPHDTANTPEEKGVLYWIVLKIPAVGKSFLGLEGAQAKALRNALLKLPVRQFRATKDIPLHLDALMQEFHGPQSALSRVRFQNVLVRLFLDIIQAANQKQSPARTTDRVLDQLKAMIGSNLSDPVSLPSLAATAGLSVPRFKVWFKEQTGLPPGEYILRRRVEAACRLLVSTDVNITTLGHEMGFSSSQYFATVIRRYTGLTPRQVRIRKALPFAPLGRSE